MASRFFVLTIFAEFDELDPGNHHHKQQQQNSRQTSGQFGFDGEGGASLGDQDGHGGGDLDMQGSSGGEAVADQQYTQDLLGEDPDDIDGDGTAVVDLTGSEEGGGRDFRFSSPPPPPTATPTPTTTPTTFSIPPPAKRPRGDARGGTCKPSAPRAYPSLRIDPAKVIKWNSPKFSSIESVDLVRQLEDGSLIQPFGPILRLSETCHVGLIRKLMKKRKGNGYVIYLDFRVGRSYSPHSRTGAHTKMYYFNLSIDEAKCLFSHADELIRLADQAPRHEEPDVNPWMRSCELMSSC